MEQELIIYTDGAARGNPGKGGYGAILMWGQAIKEVSGAYLHTTNNRMELMGVISALRALKRPGQRITVYTDSAYLVNAIEKGWLRNWLRTGFKGKKNEDLWRLYQGLAMDHTVKFVWVKGHHTNPYNNRCDELATAAADKGPWDIDTGYVAGS